MERKTIVYQAYGLKDVMRQTQLSILSLLDNLKNKEDIDVFIYTDEKIYFESFFKNIPNVKIIEITKEQIEKWRGAINFVHRVKIEILKHAGELTKGPLFYSDGDTYFLSDPTERFQEVSDRVSLMHVSESILEEANNSLTKKIYKFTKKNQFHIGNNKTLAIGPSTAMWNAGFIGISHKNKELFPLIIELTDQMYGLYQKHVMEQLAVSYFLQTNSEVKPIDDIILHYWDQKPEFQIEIDRFLNKYSTAELALKNLNKFVRPEKPAEKPKKTFWSFFRK